MMARAGRGHRHAMSFRISLACSLVLLVACSDDAPTGDGTDGEVTTGGPTSADGSPGSADDDGGSTQGGGGSGSSGSPASSDTTASGSSSDDDATASESTADPSGTGSSDGGTGSDTGASEGGSSSDGGTTAACEPITEDASAINQDCVADGDCPDGYTCQEFNGILLQQTCQILCEETCECPDGLSCVEVEDKLMIPWHQCAP